MPVPTTFDVSSQAQLNSAIGTLDAGVSAGTYTIDITGDITEGQAGQPAGIVAIDVLPGVDVDIIGNGNTLNGGGVAGGLAAIGGKVSISDLTIEDTVAKGGAGSADSGGGAGLGGGLFVGLTASVTIDGVTFKADAAKGGAGGSGGTKGGGAGGRSSLIFPLAGSASPGATGDAGMVGATFGDDGTAGGAGKTGTPGLKYEYGGRGGKGGVGGRGANGNIGANNYNGGNGGAGGTGAAGAPGGLGGNGGGGGGGGNGGGGGIGGANQIPAGGGPNGADGGNGAGGGGAGHGGEGGFGGGGGAGGAGGQGGLGGNANGGTTAVFDDGAGGVGGNAAAGGGGGFGGGGGGGGKGGAAGRSEHGGSNTVPGNGGTGGTGGTGGPGGFGGGGGGGGPGGSNGAKQGTIGVSLGTTGKAGQGQLGNFGGGVGGGGGDAGAGGPGGGGLGAGGDIFVAQGATLTVDGGLLALGTITGGTASGGAQGGGAHGNGIFLQGAETIALGAPAGTTLDVAGTISDQTGSGGKGLTAGTGALIINNTGTVKLAAKNTFVGGITIKSGTLDLAHAGAAGAGAISFDPGVLEFAATAAPTIPLQNFGAGDGIVVTGFVATGHTYQDGVLTLDGTGGPIELNLATTNPGGLQVRTAGGNTSVSIACFAEGTRIATADSEVPVERLQIGNHVATRHSHREVIWLGHRTVECARHPRPHDVWPVRVAAHAFGPGLPRRALLLSPDHAIYLGGVLVPVRYLIDGGSIAQLKVDRVTYWHVELTQHEVLFAEGLPCESYLDTGNRANFANGGGAVRLHPDFAAADFASFIWDAAACAPLVVAGPMLDAARQLLRAA